SFYRSVNDKAEYVHGVRTGWLETCADVLPTQPIWVFVDSRMFPSATLAARISRHSGISILSLVQIVKILSTVGRQATNCQSSVRTRIRLANLEDSRLLVKFGSYIKGISLLFVLDSDSNLGLETPSSS